MNALQRLIQRYLDEHPGETYASIARRGNIKAGTVQAVAKRPRKRQMPTHETLEGLARGMSMSLDVVEQAARQAAGINATVIEIGTDDEDVMMLLAVSRELDPERLRELARRARYLREEMEEEQRRRGR